MTKIKRWTKDETEYLFKYWDGEHTADAIAKNLNLLPCQVTAKAKYHKLGGKSGRGPKSKFWSQEELDYLAELAECFLFEDLVKKYNYTARANRWPRRTAKAIQQKLFHLGASTTPQVGYLNEKLVCRLLNRTYEWVRSAINKGIFPTKTQGNSNFILEKDFLRFCIIYRTEVAERIGREGIEYLLSLLAED